MKDFILSTCWNLFLAAIPVALAHVISWAEPKSRGSSVRSTGLGVLLLVWLLFLPNTCYLLTEWRHFFGPLDVSNLYVRAHYDHRLMILLMLEAAFFFCYSVTGMVAFCLAIRPIARLVRREGDVPWVWGSLLFLVVSLGVFLGLVIRFNSWDFIVRPGNILADIYLVFQHPALSAFLIVFAGVLWIAYFAIDIWVDGFLLRWKSVFGRKESE